MPASDMRGMAQRGVSVNDCFVYFLSPFCLVCLHHVFEWFFDCLYNFLLRVSIALETFCDVLLA